MNILFVTATRIGDTVLSTGVLSHLIKTYPDARITIACGARVVPLFQAAPGVEALIPMSKARFSGHWLRLWCTCVPRRWDLVVDLRGSALAYTLWARRRHIKHGSLPDVHKVMDYARVFGLSPPPAPTVWLGPEHREHAARILGGAESLIALGPTANWPAKIWPADRFAEIAERLTGPGGPAEGAHVIVVGADEERSLAEPVLAAVPKARRVDLMGADLVTTAACLARARLYVGNDSGLMHLAAASGAPTLGLFGPTSTTLYAPWGEFTSFVETPVEYPPEFDHRTSPSLMTPLSVDTVYAAATRLLQRSAEAARSS